MLARRRRFVVVLALMAMAVAVLVGVVVSRIGVRSKPARSCGDERISTFHPARCDAAGKLIPWLIDESGPFHSIMKRQAEWWLKAPMVDGWPTYVTASQLRRNYRPLGGAIPGSTISLAIEAWLKYYAYSGDAAYLEMAGTMGDYAVQRGLTPAGYATYPKFPWPAGDTSDTTPDGGGHPENSPGNVMPDKGAMIGISLLHLYEATGKTEYRDEAIHIANVLADHAVPGSARQSPWPFRVNGDTGAFVAGRVCGNQVFALRLFDELLRLGITGNGKYQATRDNVWNWLKNVAIADLSGDQWQHFFEDHTGTDYNPTQFNAFETARYLLEKREALDPNWFAMADSLIHLVKRRWIVHSGDYTAIGEQQSHMIPYNSHTARYASILAKFYELGGPAAYKDEAYHSFAYSTYSVAWDGFADTLFNSGVAWTTDSFGDWMQHFMDGIAAIPEWAPNNSDHLLRSSSVVRSVSYEPDSISYSTFDSEGQEKLKLTFVPAMVEVDGATIRSWTWDGRSHVLVVHRTKGRRVRISARSRQASPPPAAAPPRQAPRPGDS